MYEIIIEKEILDIMSQSKILKNLLNAFNAELK